MEKGAVGGLIAELSKLIGRSVHAVSTPAQAMNTMASFRADTRPSPWKLSRTDVADRAEALIRKPWLVRQGSLPVCSTAGFLRYWISRDPLSFAELVHSLYHTGQGRLGQSTAVDPDEAVIEPDDDLVEQDYATLRAGLKSDCPPADWMVLSAITDARNLVVDFEGAGGDWVGGAGWLSQVRSLFELTGLYSDLTTEHSQLSFDDVAAFKALKPGFERDVILSIDTDTLKRSGRTLWQEIGTFAPDHVAGLASPIVDDGSGGLTFVAWTWGDFEKYLLSADELDAVYHGALIAEVLPPGG